MVERLQREQAALRVLTGKLIAVVAFLKPSVVVTYDRKRRRTGSRRPLVPAAHDGNGHRES